MAELFGLPPAGPVACPRCGRLFERPVSLETASGHVDIRGHVQGDPVSCIPLRGLASIRGEARDARIRRSDRRGA